MSETVTREEQKQIENFKLPVKRVEGETVEERLTDNAYSKILPARYLLKDKDGEVIETPEEMFERVAKNVAQPAKEYGNEDFEEEWKRFYDMMTGLEFMPNCVAPTTAVGTPSGPSQITDVEEGDTVSDDDGEARVADTFRNGTKQMQTIEVEDGYSITSSREHVFRVIDGNGEYVWKQATDIAPGDWMALQADYIEEADPVNLDTIPTGNKNRNRKDISQPEEMTEELAEWLGFVIGDGTFRKRDVRVAFDDLDEYSRRRFEQLSRSLFGIDPTIGERDDKRATIVRLNSVTLVEYLKRNGLNKEYSQTAFVPEAVKKSGRQIITAFLRGLFDADGSVEERAISLYTSSEKLAEDVQQLLLGLDIVSRRQPKRSGYRVSVRKNEDGARFVGRIGFVSNRKNESLERFKTVGENATTRKIPNQQERLLDWYRESDLGLKFYRRASQFLIGRDSRYSQHISREMFENLSSEYPELKESPVAKLVERNQVYKRVESISDAGTVKACDLNVPNRNTFIADGFVSHNSPTLMNAGADLQQLSACFVVHPEDDMDSIFNGVHDAANIFQTGGGVGYPFHLMRPKGDPVASTGGIASGPLTFQQVFDTMCFVPGTRVLTPSGYRPIENLVEGDDVVDESGKTQTVTETMQREVDEEIVQLVPERLNQQLEMTGNHPVKVFRDGEMQWMEAGELEEDDMLVLQTGQEEAELDTSLDMGNVVTGPFIVRDTEIEIDPDYYGRKKGVPSTFSRRIPRDSFARLAGWYLAEGSVSYQRGIPGSLVFTLRIDEEDYRDEILDLLSEFGADAVTETEPSRNTLHVKAHNSALAGFFKYIFGAGYDVKSVPDFLWTASKETQMDVVEALFNGDGYLQKRGDGQRASIKLANREIIDFVHHVGLRHGVQFGRYHESNQFKSDSYAAKLSISSAAGTAVERLFDEYPADMRMSDRTVQKTVEEQRHQLIGIKDIDRKHYSGGVHNLEVTGSHTYVAEGIVAHNCGTIKQGGKRRGAQMGIMRVDHPDVLRFIVSKRKEGNLSNFNISVGLTDEFMEAVKNDEEYDLINPRTGELHEVTDKTAEFYNSDEEWYPEAAGSDQGRDDNFWRDFAQTFSEEIEKYDIELEPGKDMKLPARFIWNALIDGAWRNGEPGLFMYDTSNEMHSFDVEEHPEHRMDATNPCVTGDTLIHTQNGMFTAEELYEQGIANNVVVDGRQSDEQFKEASSVYNTGVKEVFKVVTEEGYELRVTADHRIMTGEGWKEARELESDDEVHILNRKGGFGHTGTQEEGRVLGWLVGDGQMKDSEERAVLHFYGEDTSLSQTFANHVNAIVREPEGNADYEIGVSDINRSSSGQMLQTQEQRVRSERLYELAQQHGLVDQKLQVPERVFRGSESMTRGFLQSLFTADGSVEGSAEKGVRVKLTSVEKELLKDVQTLLTQFGIASTIYDDRHPEGPMELPDGSGETKEYHSQARHELYIVKENLSVFREEIGFIRQDKQERLERLLDSYSRGPYSESFTASVESVEFDGHEAVYDLTEPDTNSFVANGVVVHNCAEQPLENYEACNLGHINLSLLVEDQGDGKGLNWHEWAEEHGYDDLDAAMQAFLQDAMRMDEFERIARTGTRFLDNVVTMSDFPLEEIEDKVREMRKIGLGLMGFAQMLIQLGIRYGSEESQAAAKEVQRLITRFAAEESRRLAEERGTFPEWGKSKWASPTDYPEWFRKYSGGMDPEEWSEGLPLRNHNLVTIAPTGCVTTDSLISTDSGLQEIDSFQGEEINKQWSETSTSRVQSDDGTVEATRHFDNGTVEVEKIVTEHGFEVAATANHKFRVIDEQGRYVWRKAEDIKENDRIVLLRDTIDKDYRPVELDTSEMNNLHHNSSQDLRVADEMTEELAEFLGYYMGDGYVHEDVAVKVAVETGEDELEQHLRELGQSVFGVEPTVEDKDSRKLLCFGGRHLPRYFNENGWRKEKGNHGEGAASAFVPEQVMDAGRKPAAAFLRGLFEADGTCPRKVELSTVSEKLARQVQTLLLSLGVVFARETKPADDLGDDHFGERDRHVLRGVNKREDKRFLDDIGFITKEPNVELELTPQSSKNDDFPSALVEELTEADGFDSIDQNLKHRTRQSRYQSLTRQTAEQVVEQVEEDDLAVKRFIENDFFLGTVATKEEGVARTHDLEVPENNTYIANGFVSHNTTSMIGNTSGGCEPIYSLAYFKNVAKDIQGEDMLVEFDDYFLKALDANGVDVEEVKEEAEELMRNNEWEGVHSIPDEVLPQEMKELFVTADMVEPEEHVDVQAAFQEHNHSGISKTINFPNDAAREDVAEAYMRAYDKGIKGLTVYRDGARDVQVMTTRKDNKIDDLDKADLISELVDEFDGTEDLLTSEEFHEAAGLKEESGLMVRKNGDGSYETQTIEPGEEPETGGEGVWRKPRERPEIITGTTQKIDTGYGGMYVTINEDKDGIFEVFLQLGKSGGYTQSFTDAIGRLVSTALRAGIEDEEVIEQLEGIRSPKIAWDNSDQVLSVPDGVAKAMKRYLSGEASAAQTSVKNFSEEESADEETGDEIDTSSEVSDTSKMIGQGMNPECPECGGMLQLQEGCKTCPECGWSECE